MYFINQNTRAVTEKDYALLAQVCVALRTICFLGAKMNKQNPDWETRTMECHSIARFLSLLFKGDLKLVDGVLIGLSPTEDVDVMNLVHTNHSWLTTPDGAIIDPYPMGVISTTGALLIPSSGTVYCAHGGNLYREHPQIRERFDVGLAWRTAKSIIRTLRKNKDKIEMAEIIKTLI